MYKINGLTHYVQVHGQSLALAQPLPQNTGADGNGGPVRAGGTQGAIEVIVRANTALTIADGKALTVSLQHRTGTAPFSDLATVVSFTATGDNGAIARDTELGRFVLPGTTGDEVRAVIATTDPAASGRIDVLPTYQAR